MIDARDTGTLFPDDLPARFEAAFGHPPELISSAPGRVNLIGEHTDYNEGFVLPVAIDRRTWIAVGRNSRNTLDAITALDGTRTSLRLEDLDDHRQRGWSSYIAGVAALLRGGGVAIEGVDLFVMSTVPLGAGLSSSAALEIAAAVGLLASAGRSMPTIDVAKLCQRAEWDWAGVKCGIMDQFIVAAGKSSSALFLDCRTLETEQVPLDASLKLVVCDTTVPRTLAASEYNKRRAECGEAVSVLSSADRAITSLRDVTPSLLAENAGRLSDIPLRRARHVVSENERVQTAVDALWNRSYELLGRLLNESHSSLRDDYNVSCPELDVITAIGRSTTGVFGARMTGAGFGGCALALASPDAVEPLTRRVMAEYPARTSRTPVVTVCSVGDGARVLRLQ